MPISHFVYATGLQLPLIQITLLSRSMYGLCCNCCKIISREIVSVRTLYQFKHAIRVSLTRSLEPFGTWNYFQWSVAFTRFTRNKKFFQYNDLINIVIFILMRSSKILINYESNISITFQDLNYLNDILI